MSYEVKIAAIDAKIAKLVAEKEALVSQRDNDVALKVTAGDAVEFVYGRAGKRRSLIGVVVARKVQDKGPDLVKVQIGEGFEAEFVTIYPANVVRIVTPEATPVFAIAA